MLSSQVKFSADRQTDRQMDRWTPVKQYAPDLSMRGHKNLIVTWLKQKIDFRIAECVEKG